jgi:hypothetical protein
VTNLNPADVLGAAMLEAVRQVVRAEMEAARKPDPMNEEFFSPPEASARLGGRPSAETIIGWVKAGRIQLRSNNIAANPKRMKYLVRLEDVRAAMTPQPAREPEPLPTPIEAARQRAREKAAKT